MRARLSLLTAAGALALVVAVAALGEIIRPAQYFGGYVAPGQGGHTDYSDGCSSWWINNKAVWPGGNYARLTYIDLNGGWHYTYRSTINPIAQDTRSSGRRHSAGRSCVVKMLRTSRSTTSRVRR